MANSKRKCAYCKKRVRDYIVINTQAFCSRESAIKWSIENKSKGALKIKKEKDKKHARKKKEYYDNHKPTRTEAAQKAFNAYIRARDSGCGCISCGRSTGCKINAGHYKSVGSSPELRFNELNVHLQCEHCNMFKSGNIENYRANLINKIGLYNVEWLEGTHEPKKYTCSQLKEIELEYKQRLKDLV